MFKYSQIFFTSLALFLLLNTDVVIAQQGQVTVNQSKEIDELIDIRKDLNKKSYNFKIQVYSGSREGALNARSEFAKSFSAWYASTEFETPNYKIWVGNFKTRLEADRALLKIKKKFPNAFIFKPKRKR